MCGDNNQTEECEFMKKAQAIKLVQEQTSKTKGKIKVESIDLKNNQQLFKYFSKTDLDQY